MQRQRRARRHRRSSRATRPGLACQGVLPRLGILAAADARPDSGGGWATGSGIGTPESPLQDPPGFCAARERATPRVRTLRAEAHRWHFGLPRPSAPMVCQARPMRNTGWMHGVPSRSPAPMGAGERHTAPGPDGAKERRAALAPRGRPVGSTLPQCVERRQAAPSGSRRQAAPGAGWVGERGVVVVPVSVVVAAVPA